MAKRVTLRVSDFTNIKFGTDGAPKSRAVSITQKGKHESYRVDMTAPASSTVTVAGKKRSAVVKMSGTASAVVRVISAVTKSKPSLLKSVVLTISGAKPVEG